MNGDLNMNLSTEFSNLYKIFEWSSDAVAIINENKIVYTNRAFKLLFPFIKPNASAQKLLPAGADISDDDKRITLKGAVIGDFICDVTISNLGNSSIVTISNAQDKKALAADDATLRSWLEGECAKIKGPLLTITSALSLVIKTLPDDAYPQFSDYLTSINLNNYKLHKILNNIEHIINRISAEDKRSVEDLSLLCKSFSDGFHSFFSPLHIELSYSGPDSELLAYCSLSELRRTIYNILDFFIDCLTDGGDISFSLSEHDNKAVMRFSASISQPVTEKFTNFYDDARKEKARFINSVARAHNGSLSVSPDKCEIVFSIDRALPEFEFIRDNGTEYETGVQDILTELSDILPPEFYRIK